MPLNSRANDAMDAKCDLEMVAINVCVCVLNVLQFAGNNDLLGVYVATNTPQVIQYQLFLQ